MIHDALRRRLRGWADWLPSFRQAKPARPERDAIVTIISDNFFGLGGVLVASLAKQIDFAGKDLDFCILTDDRFAPLSARNQAIVARLLPQTRFLPISSDFVTEERTRPAAGVKTHDERLPHKAAAFLKLSLLRLSEYRKVLWVDSDMLCLADITDLFSLPARFAAVESRPASPHVAATIRRRGAFNAGLMLFDNALLGDRQFDAAMRIMDRGRRSHLRDQAVFKELLRGRRKMFLPHAYNWRLPRKWTEADGLAAIEHAKMVHFVSNRKWVLRDVKSPLTLCRLFHQIREEAGVPLVIRR